MIEWSSRRSIILSHQSQRFHAFRVANMLQRKLGLASVVERDSLLLEQHIEGLSIEQQLRRKRRKQAEQQEASTHVVAARALSQRASV